MLLNNLSLNNSYKLCFGVVLVKLFSIIFFLGYEMANFVDVIDTWQLTQPYYRVLLEVSFCFLQELLLELIFVDFRVLLDLPYSTLLIRFDDTCYNFLLCINSMSPLPGVFVLHTHVEENLYWVSNSIHINDFIATVFQYLIQNAVSKMLFIWLKYSIFKT